MKHESALSEVKSHRVSNSPTRRFYWLNVLCMLARGEAGFADKLRSAVQFEFGGHGKSLLKNNPWFCPALHVDTAK